MVRGVIFDLDGTLVDSNDLHAAAWQEAFRHFGKEFRFDELRRHIGKGGDQYLPMFLDPVELQTMGAEVNEYRSEVFKSKFLSRIRPFPKVRELFEKLRSEGKKIALASSGSAADVDHYVKLADVGGLIEAQTTKDDVRHSKPAPDVFLAALNELDLPAQEAIVVGDTPYDVDAAKKTQLLTIGLLCGGFPEDELRASGAVAIYRDVADLLASYHRSPLA
jgi:HAD superfamily hydrolase (TIGR01509 family)